MKKAFYRMNHVLIWFLNRARVEKYMWVIHLPEKEVNNSSIFPPYQSKQSIVGVRNSHFQIVE